MGSLKGRVAIVTGAGSGLGREHARLLGAEGAAVVVNDVGAAVTGEGRDASAAEAVAAEIRAAGGEAVADTHDISTWDGGRALVDGAVERYGEVHVLVNNAGILRERMLFNMSEDDWDAVIAVHLKGHFVPTRWAAAHWRDAAKAGADVDAVVINTSSASGLFGQPGQISYGAAKAGIAGFTSIAAKELGRYGVRVNAIVPAARTRMTDATTQLAEAFRAPDSGFDRWDPANVSPLVAALAREACPITGEVFYVSGGTVRRMQPWRMAEELVTDGRWSVDALADRLGDLPRTEASEPSSLL